MSCFQIQSWRDIIRKHAASAITGCCYNKRLDLMRSHWSDWQAARFLLTIINGLEYNFLFLSLGLMSLWSTISWQCDAAGQTFFQLLKNKNVFWERHIQYWRSRMENRKQGGKENSRLKSGDIHVKKKSSLMSVPRSYSTFNLLWIWFPKCCREKLNQACSNS